MSFLEILAFIGTALKAGAVTTGWILLGAFLGTFLATGLIVFGWFALRRRNWKRGGACEKWIRIGVLAIWILTIPGMMIGSAALIGFGHGIKNTIDELGLVEQACEKVLGYPVAYALVHLDPKAEAKQSVEEELSKRVDDLIAGKEEIRIEKLREDWTSIGRSALTNALTEASEDVQPESEGMVDVFAGIIGVKLRQWLAQVQFAMLDLAIDEIGADLAARDQLGSADGLVTVSEITATATRLYIQPRVDLEFTQAMRLQFFLLAIPPLLFLLLPPAIVEAVLYWLRKRDAALALLNASSKDSES
jgi:hypothetical protein